MTHKQDGLLCCKPPEIFPEGLIPPVVTSGQARRLRRHCLVPCASSFPRVQASKLPCADGSASAMWPCCIWSLLHVEPLHICDLPAATASKSCLVFFAFSPISCRPRLRSNLPLLLPHMHAGIAPLLRLYILFLYVYRRSPRQWPASETLLSFRAAGPTLRCRRRAWDSAPTSAPESLALLHARNRFLWRHSCLLPDRTTSSRTRRSFRSCRTRWRPSSFGLISHRVNAGRLLATCQVPLKSSTVSLGGVGKKKAASLAVYYFQNKLSWSWPCRHRAAAVTVVSSCPSRR